MDNKKHSKGGPKKGHFKRQEELELKTLHTIARAGHISTRILAQAVWNSSASEHSAVNRAQLVTKRLEKKGEVLARDIPGMGRTWVLTKPGAEALRLKLVEEGAQEEEAAWIRHGLDLGVMDWMQHYAALEALIEAEEDPQTVAVLYKNEIRLRRIEELKGLDGAVVSYDENWETKKEGVLLVTGVGDSTITQVVEVKKRLRRAGWGLVLLGNERAVKMVKRKAGL